ncbi:MAG: HlyD family efflux transporter periplasmic adaptor subunit [Planctomycetota bacterium]
MRRLKRSNAAGSEVASIAVTVIGLLCASVTAAEVRVPSAILTVGGTLELPAPAAGVLRKLTIHEGERITAGAAIAEVDSREPRLDADVIKQDLAVARRESESDVRVRLARKQHRVAEAELARATTVNAELPNTVSAKEVDRLRLAMESSQLEIEHAVFEQELLVSRLGRIEADLRLAEHRVAKRSVASPIDGVVAELYRHAGEWVDEGQPIARVVRVRRLRAEGYVGIEDALSGLINRPVVVSARLPSGETLQAVGRVVFVSPEAEPVDSKVRFWAEIDNRDLRMRPGLTAEVAILDAGIDATTRLNASEPRLASDID